MSKSDKEEYTREEIRKEFQLERMIFFSDAVFAIVITLMAIEIKLPEDISTHGGGMSLDTLQYLAPTFLAYCVSFLFIGTIWYQHLTIFSLLKDYDKGLVVRNLILLFFIGLFPFCATAIAKAHGAMLPFFIYAVIILSCIISQYVLHDYILIKRPSLRLNTNIDEQIHDLKKRRLSLLIIAFDFLLVFITYQLIPDPNEKSLATLWMISFPLLFRLMKKKMKLK